MTTTNATGKASIISAVCIASLLETAASNAMAMAAALRRANALPDGEDGTDTMRAETVQNTHDMLCAHILPQLADVQDWCINRTAEASKGNNAHTPKPAPAVLHETLAPKADAVPPADVEPEPKQPKQPKTPRKPRTPKEEPKQPKGNGAGLEAFRKLRAECKARGLNTKGKNKATLEAMLQNHKMHGPTPKAEPKPEPAILAETAKPAGKPVSKLATMAATLGVKLEDMLAAAELAGVKLT